MKGGKQSLHNIRIIIIILKTAMREHAGHVLHGNLNNEIFGGLNGKATCVCGIDLFKLHGVRSSA
jgi:hypothetical protein